MGVTGCSGSSSLTKQQQAQQQQQIQVKGSSLVGRVMA
jgi:hypothetical protein